MSIKLTYPLTRFNDWQAMGAVKRAADTRTTEELTQTIKLWADHNQEAKEFLPHLKEMNPKHFGLVADTIELAHRRSILPKNINMLGQTSAGKSLLGVLLDIFPRASKENPNALDFAQEVINNTDTLTSKYFLWQTTGGILENKSVSEHFKAAKPLVEAFAKETLEHPNPYSFAEQEGFMTLVKSVIEPAADPKKISIVKDALDAISNKAMLHVSSFVESKAPVEKIKDNISTVGQVTALMDTSKGLRDMTDYLTKNTNLY